MLKNKESSDFPLQATCLCSMGPGIDMALEALSVPFCLHGNIPLGFRGDDGLIAWKTFLACLSLSARTRADRHSRSSVAVHMTENVRQEDREKKTERERKEEIKYILPGPIVDTDDAQRRGSFNMDPSQFPQSYFSGSSPPPPPPI